MVDKKEKKIEVKAEKETGVDEPWDPFRVPAHLESSFFDDPWLHPWIRRHG